MIMLAIPIPIPTTMSIQIMAERVLKHDKIEMVWDSQIVAYHGDGKLESLTLRNIKTKEEKKVCL